MRFTVFTHVEHNFTDNSYFAYSPYVREMNIWIDKFDQIEIVAPIQNKPFMELKLPYKHSYLEFKEVFAFNLLNLKSFLHAIVILPFNCYIILMAMYKSDHIHIRTPGNIGLLACIIQIIFPFKKKTVKYAGNWDSRAKQPWSYNLQKRILKNRFLTRNCKVLVYGDWPKQSRNIVPFFTASFSETEKAVHNKDFSSPFKFIFVGSLSPGKRPLFAIKLVEALMGKGVPVQLEVYGSGMLQNELQEYITVNNLNPYVQLMGVQKLEELKEVYKNSHFLILASQSEGWPKAVAEAMFFGCIPIATFVSCVPYMLDHGERGILIEPELDKAILSVITYLKNEKELNVISYRAITWSRQFTLEKFEKEISNLI